MKKFESKSFIEFFSASLLFIVAITSVALFHSSI